MSTLKTNNIQHVDRSDPSIIINTDGSVNIAGTMTYEDVTNVDAVGIITGRSLINAQKQIHVGTGVSVKAGGINVTAGISTFQAVQGTTGTFSAAVSGTTGTFSGDVAASKITNTGGDTDTFINFPSADTFKVSQSGNDTFHINSSGKVSINTTDTTGAYNLVVTAQGGSDTGMTFRGATSSQQVIRFADGTSGGAENIGEIEYDHNTNKLSIDVAGTERFQITNVGALGLSGANYGSSGQVLTSQGSGSAVAWSTITGTTINTNADNRIITGSGTANTLNGESELTFTGGVLKNVGAGYRYNQVGSTNAGGASIILDGDSNGDASGGDYAYILHDTSGDLNIVATNPADNSKMRFYTGSGAEAMRLDSSGRLNLGNNLGQSTHMLYLSSTGDAGIHIRADSDNSGENDNPYVSFSQDGSNNQELKIGQNGVAGENFALSLDNSPFIHANHSAAYPLQLAHMDTMCASISSRHNELGINNYSGCATAGMEIQHRGNDTGAALKLTGHNNTGTPGVETFTQLTHIGSNLTFEIFHAGNRAIHIGSTRRIRLPGIVGVSGSGLVTVQVESDGNLCTQSSLRAHKINIASISDNSWLYNLNPVTFNWRTKTEVDGENVWGDTADNNGTQYGLIAEEVKEVKNDFCYYDNNGDLSGVHYDRMIAPLIKAVQDLKKENDDLKTRIVALEGS